MRHDLGDDEACLYDRPYVIGVGGRTSMRSAGPENGTDPRNFILWP